MTAAALDRSQKPSWTTKVTLRRSKAHATLRDELAHLLDLIPRSFYAHLHDPAVVSQWKYVYKNGGAYVGRVDTDILTQAWEDAHRAVAELYCVTNPATQMGQAYAAFTAKAIAQLNAANPTTPPSPAPAPPPMSGLSAHSAVAPSTPVIPPPPSSPNGDLDVDLDQQLRDLNAQLLTTVASPITDPQRGAAIGRIAAEMAAVSAQIEQQQRAMQAAAPPTPAPAPAPVPPLPAIATPTSAPPSAAPRSDFADWKLHALATERAREVYLGVLGGSDPDIPDHIKRRVSVDYAVIRGLITYWYHWMAVRIGSFATPVFDSTAMTLENPICADEARKLLDFGIPADFLFHKDFPDTPLYNTADLNNLPITGFPVTPEYAAFLVMIRPPTWLTPLWIPPAVGPYRHDGNQTVDLLFNCDPIKSQRTGKVERLAIPPHLTSHRHPVLTVPEAFMTWALTSAATMGAIPFSEVPFLSKAEAAPRVFAYADIDRWMGINSPVRQWSDLKLNWEQRKQLGESLEDIVRDLGPPPSPPSPAIPDWESFTPQLKSATIRHLPFLAHWVSLPARIHADPRAGAKPLNLLAEINKAATGVPLIEEPPITVEASETVIDITSFAPEDEPGVSDDPVLVPGLSWVPDNVPWKP